MTLLNCDRLITHYERRESLPKITSIDVIFQEDANFLGWRNLEVIELANG
jgi:hypothetical protein